MGREGGREPRTGARVTAPLRPLSVRRNKAPSGQWAERSAAAMVTRIGGSKKPRGRPALCTKDRIDRRRGEGGVLSASRAGTCHGVPPDRDGALPLRTALLEVAFVSALNVGHLTDLLQTFHEVMVGQLRKLAPWMVLRTMDKLIRRSSK